MNHFMTDNSPINWNGYNIFRIDDSHYRSLIDISISAFNIRTTYQYFINKNNTSGFGAPNLGYIAYDEKGNPAAFYGVFACQAIHNDRIIPVAQSGDTMTHRDHMGKGLFIKLAELTYELCRNLGFAFVFGFPNYNSYPGFAKKLKWEFPGKLNEYRWRVRTLPLAKVAKKMPLFNPFYKAYRNLINCFYRCPSETISSSVIEEGIGGILRSPAYMNYKIKVTGSYLTRIGDADCWLKTDGFLFVGDLMTDGSDFRELIKKLNRYAFLIGADVIVFQTTIGTSLDKKFSELMKPTEGLPWGYCNFDSSFDPSVIRYVTADIDVF